MSLVEDLIEDETAPLTSADLAEIADHPEPAAPETAVDDRGWIYVVETGEIIGRVGVDDQFHIDNPEAADWALRLRSEIEGDILALDARFKALQEQFQTQRRVLVRRLSWWDFRFAHELVALAKRMLLGKKVRTAQFNWGRVAFRATQGVNEIMDMGKAVDFVKVWKPDAVKVKETVGVKDVLAAKGIAEKTTGETAADDMLWFVAGQPGESHTISTGIVLEGGKS